MYVLPVIGSLASKYARKPHSRPVIINHNKVSAALTDFTFLFSGTYSYLKTVANGGKVENDNGWDIKFYSDVNALNILPYEIEKYDSTTGEIVAWIKMPSLSSTVDTIIYMLYGDAGERRYQGNSPNSWDNNYKMVIHGGDGSVLNINDITGDQSIPTNTAVTAGAGKVSGGGSFNGTSSVLTYSTSTFSLERTDPVSFEFWVKSLDSSGQKRIAGKFNTRGYLLLLNRGDTGGGSAGYVVGKISLLLSNATSNRIEVYTTNVTLLNDGNFHRYVLTYDGSSNASGVKIYEDGQPLAVTTLTNSLSSTLIDTTAFFGIGNVDAAAGNGVSGIIDEFRVSDIVRSADWVLTDYNTQSDPSTFYSVGDET